MLVLFWGRLETRVLFIEKGTLTSNTIAPAEFQAILPSICDRETCVSPEDIIGWTFGNPLYAHCAVVSLVAQDLFGGELVRASLEPFPEFAHMRSHYWNRLPDGTEVDFTEPQFFGRRPALVGEPRTRSYALYNPKTGAPREIMERYKLLALRLARVRSGGNPLFDDEIYRQCFSAALDSPCQKMKFGCVITHKGFVAYQGANKTIPELCSLCEPKCIRFSITSRTESMLGSCGHAEEWGIWDLVPRGVSLAECELYVAGFYPDGFPWIKKAPEHTCLRCAVQMHNAHLKAVHVPVGDCWMSITTAQALETARAYAMQEKKV